MHHGDTHIHMHIYSYMYTCSTFHGYNTGSKVSLCTTEASISSINILMGSCGMSNAELYLCMHIYNKCVSVFMHVFAHPLHQGRTPIFQHASSISGSSFNLYVLHPDARLMSYYCIINNNTCRGPHDKPC